MEPTQKHRWTRWLITLAAMPVILFAAYTWLTLNWSYSTGERAGYVQKFSQKGWLCKTWEGDLAMITMPGTIAEKFYFTVHDEAVIKKVTQLMGKRVTLTYQQHVGIPTRCFGDTEYFVTDIRAVSESVVQ